MTNNTQLRLDLPLVLPGIDDARDRCVARLIDLLEGRPGIAEVHMVGSDGPSPELCIHYDPSTLSLSRVRELAQAAGAELSAAFGHLVISTSAAMQPRAASRIAESLRKAPGVVEADVAASGAVRIEFDRGKTSEKSLRDAAAKLGLGAEGPSAEAAEHAPGQVEHAGHDHASRRPVRRKVGADLRHPRGRSVGQRLADRVARSRPRLAADGAVRRGLLSSAAGSPPRKPSRTCVSVASRSTP
jgi:Cd2+/Zn2+-exporting ATPase